MTLVLRIRYNLRTRHFTPLKWYVSMKLFALSLLLLATQLEAPENGNLISEPILNDFQNAQRAPGIMGTPEEVQDANGNPVSL